jgi:hypothetical protein
MKIGDTAPDLKQKPVKDGFDSMIGQRREPFFFARDFTSRVHDRAWLHGQINRS